MFFSWGVAAPLPIAPHTIHGFGSSPVTLRDLHRLTHVNVISVLICDEVISFQTA
jgi:hypothetical protein